MHFDQLLSSLRCRAVALSLILVSTSTYAPQALASSSSAPEPYSAYSIFKGKGDLKSRIETVRSDTRLARKEVAGFVGKEEGKKDKLLFAYDRILGDLDLLEKEKRPDAQENLAREIIELSYALKTKGELRPISMILHHISALFDTWSIPRTSPLSREASDLHNPSTGKALSPAEYRASDLSKMDPAPNSPLWRRPVDISRKDVEENYYHGGTQLSANIDAKFPEGAVQLESVKRNQSVPKLEVSVRTKNGKKRQYTLKFGRESFADPTVSSLMALLGYSGRISKHVPEQKVYLNGQTLNEFKVDFMSYYNPENTMTSFDLKDYLVRTGKDEGGEFIVIRDGELEYAPKELVRIGSWGYRANGHERLRELRGLMLFNLWVSNTDIRDANTKVVLKETEGGSQLHMMQHDSSLALGGIIAEQVDRFYYDAVKKKTTLFDFMRMNPQFTNLFKSKNNKEIVFTHIGFEPNPLADQWTFADGKWMARLIAQTTRKQIADAVRLGGWPEDAAVLLTEKLIERRNDLIRAFDLENEFAVLPADRAISTPDGVVKNGEMKNGNFPGVSKNFANYYSELLKPLRVAFQRLAISGVQMAIGSTSSVRLEGAKYGINQGVVAQVIVGMGRNIQERAYPTSDRDVWGKRNAATSDRDRFLVEDVVKLGFRGGFGFLAYGDGTITIQYRLIQPARTYDEALVLDRHIIDYTLPYDVLKARLPKNYVLHREIFVEGAGRLRDLPDNLPISLGGEGSLSKFRLSRVTIDHKSEEKLVLSEDTAPYYQAQVSGLLGVLELINTPFYEANKKFDGHLEGDSFLVSGTEVQNDSQLSEAVSNVISLGSFLSLRKLTEEKKKAPIHYSASFNQSHSTFSIPLIPFLNREKDFNSERVSIKNPETGSQTDLIQHRTHALSSWWFLDNGETQQLNIFTGAPDLGDKSSSLDKSRIELQYHVHDLDTRSDEISGGYFKLVRELALDDPKNPMVLPFTPNLHSNNDRFQQMEMFVSVQYCAPFIEKLVNLNSSEYWTALATTLNMSNDQMATQLASYRRYKSDGKPLPMEIRDSGLDAIFWHSQLFLQELESAKRHSGTYQKLRHVTLALKKANFMSQHTFQPSIIATLNRLSEGNFFLHALPVRPHDQQSLFPGGRDPNAVEIGKPCAGTAEQVLLFPLDAEELWTMYDWVSTAK